MDDTEAAEAADDETEATGTPIDDATEAIDLDNDD